MWCLRFQFLAFVTWTFYNIFYTNANDIGYKSYMVGLAVSHDWLAWLSLWLDALCEPAKVVSFRLLFTNRYNLINIPFRILLIINNPVIITLDVEIQAYPGSRLFTWLDQLYRTSRGHSSVKIRYKNMLIRRGFYNHSPLSTCSWSYLRHRHFLTTCVLVQWDGEYRERDADIHFRNLVQVLKRVFINTFIQSTIGLSSIPCFTVVQVLHCFSNQVHFAQPTIY